MEEDLDLPAERETKDFQFKQLKKIRVFDSPDDLPRERSTLLAISNKYGLLFACGPTGLKIFHTKNVLVTNQAGENPNNIVGASPDIEVPLQLPVHHVALSADSLTLSLCMASKDNGTFISFYDVRTLLNKSTPQKHAFAYHKLSRDSNSFVSDLKWNPGIPTLVAVCLSDGSISVLEVKDIVSQFANLPASLGVTSACWSPKGKQLAVGKLDGTVVQYLPNLQEKKVIPCASFYSSENPVKVLDVLWLSTYAFTVVYAAADGSLETPPQLVVVLLPKKDERRAERFLNFTDTCFGSVERQHHYFLNFIEDWEILLGASATSIEVSVIAKAEDQVNWELWLLEDSGRAELPVTDNSDDTLPMGVVVDYTSQMEVFISEEKILPPAPVLLILSTDGVLCPFQIINVNPRVKPVTVSLEQLSLEGGRQMQPLAALSVPPAASPAAAAPAVASLAFSLPTSVPASNSPSAFSFGTSAASAKIAAPPAYSFQPMQGSATFGAVAAKPDIAASAPQIASPSIFTAAAAASSVKVNLKDKFSALETAPALSSSVTMPTTFIPNSTKTLGEVASRAPAPSFPSLGSITAHKPITPEVTQSAQKSARVNPPAAKQATPQANTYLQNQTKPLKDSDPVLTAIQEEITHFQKEMNELKNSTANSDFFLGKEEEKRQLRTETENLNAFVLDIKETTESLHGDVGTLKTSILESFASVQGAREENERKQDSRYRHLLYKKPLDPKSEAQMQEIRRLHQYVKFAVQDVNDVLDLEWDRYLQERKKQKGLVVPERETLFNTLANNLEIINQQKRRLNQLVDSLQKLRLYNQTSQWNTPIEESSSKNFEVELESLRNALSKTTIEAQSKPLPKVPPKLSSVKQSQLRNFLTKRKTPPVRSLAPACLSRSSFLAPSYYEDLDDVSYTSSLSEAADTDDRRVAPQEIERQETPPPEPSTVRVPRHAPVARTVSIQPNFVSPSFGKPQLGPGPISSTPAPSAQSIRVIPQGADSTMLATKTVKHGAPTVAATQAAGAAALRRQMASQVPAPLTESTLQTVPQVVNVKELKGNGPGPTIPTVLGPSVPHSAAQVIHQVLATVGSTQAKQGFPTGAVKMAPVPTSAHGTAAASGLGAVSSKPAAIGQTAPAASAPAISALTTSSQITKAFQFSPAGSGFNFSSVSSGVSSSATIGSSKAGPGTAAPTNQTSQSPSFVFGPVNKLVFGSGSESNFSYGSLKPASGPAPTLQPLQTPAVSSSTPTSKPETTATKSEDGLFQSFSGGETLGSFSGLRVGQAEEAPRAAATAQPAKLSSSNPMFSFTGVVPPSKPAEASSTTNSSSTVLFGNAQTTNTGSSSLLFSKPSVVSSSTTPPVEAPSVQQNTTALSFGNLLNAASSTPASGTPAPVTAASATFTVTSVPGHAAPSTTAPVVAFLPSTPSLAPSAPVPVLAAPSSCTEVKQFVKPDKSHGEGSAQHHSPATLTSVQASAPLATTSISPLVTSVATAVPTQSSPVAESVASSAVPASAASNQNAIITSSSIIVAPAASTSSPQTAVIATAAPSPAAAASSQVASAPADTATTGSAFVPTAASTPAAATTPTFGQTPGSGTVSAPFGQAVSSPANTVANTGSGFGAPAFGVAGVSGGFGQASFGQGPTFWKAPASSASNFSFTQSSFGSQPAFGQPPASTVVSSSGSLFGSSASTTSASSFSFGQPTNSGTSTAGGGLFGQSSAPVFGQSSGFGQGASVFGSASSSTTTTSSSGFSFGQPSGFASNSSGSLFGQSQNSNTSVFGQQPPSSSGGLFGSSSGTGSGGGGFFSGLGGKPSQEAANKNPFGATSPGFGSSNQSNPSSLFGNSGAKTFGFGSSSFGEQKSAGTFSAGGSVASQGFGFSSPAKTGGFGAAPVFGSPPTFGGSPGFGGVPAFGTAPAFSSPLGSTGGKVFGEGTAAANTGGFGFGSSTSNTTFGSLASQNTPTFGALSQQGTGFGAQSSGFSGFASGGAGTGTGSSGGFGFGSNQSSSTFGGGWRS
ncbi:nuclear pore complex protein Nup214 isoform X2 [Bombina bombina]|uniref:nuclear pore complex protein Nup214 isoform X2 n=1 Tax=Bombina bombina TaxID=8345 RepID=UPI00235B1D5B|nr:nuclear pore complex protein Nup214 isoform X2 [Bombina bombina]